MNHNNIKSDRIIIVARFFYFISLVLVYTDSWEAKLHYLEIKV